MVISKILIVSSNYFPKIGGIETQINILAKAFIRKNVETHIVTETQGFHEEDQMMASVKRIKSYKHLDLVNIFIMVLTFLRLLRHRTPDLIICRSVTKITIITAFFAVINLIKVKVLMFIDTYEELDFIDNLPFLKRKVIKSLLNKCILVAPSSGIETELLKRKYIEDKIFVIPNGLDFLETRPANQEIINQNSFAFLGTLNTNKGIKEVVNVFLNLCPRHANLFLYIAGEGPLKSELTNLVKGYGLENQIIFVGPILSSSDRNLFLSSKKNFIFASKRESFGLAAFEARFQGLTLLTRKVADIPKYFSKSAYFFDTEEDLKTLVTLSLEGKLTPKGSVSEYIECLDIDNISKNLLDNSFNKRIV
jgi:glycosyltransferase involved in cell wall biosynthesis